MDISCGSIKWKFQTGDIIKSTPLVLLDSVYAGSYDKSLYKLNPVSIVKFF